MEQQQALKMNIARTRSGAVRVVMPAEVAFNLDKFQAAVKNLAERLGHPNCLSGQDIRFILESDFVVNATTLKVDPRSEPWLVGVQDPDGDPI